MRAVKGGERKEHGTAESQPTRAALSRIESLSTALQAAIVSFLRFSEHVETATLCRTIRQACQRAISWPPRLDLSLVLNAPSSAWVARWNMRPKHAAISDGDGWRQLLQAKRWQQLVSLRVSDVGSRYQFLRDRSFDQRETSQFWSHLELPALQSLCFSDELNLKQLDPQRMPSLTELTLCGTTRFEWNPSRLPRLRHLDLECYQRDSVPDASVPVLRRLTTVPGSWFLPMGLVLLASSFERRPDLAVTLAFNEVPQDDVVISIAQTAAALLPRVLMDLRRCHSLFEDRECARLLRALVLHELPIDKLALPAELHTEPERVHVDGFLARLAASGVAKQIKQLVVIATEFTYPSERLDSLLRMHASGTQVTLQECVVWLPASLSREAFAKQLASHGGGSMFAEGVRFETRVTGSDGGERGEWLVDGEDPLVLAEPMRCCPDD